MATSNNNTRFGAADLHDLTRYGSRSRSQRDADAPEKRSLGYEKTDPLMRAELRSMRIKIAVTVVVLAVLCFFSLCLTGNMGKNYLNAGAYCIFTPDEVLQALWVHFYNLVANVTHLFAPYSQGWIYENVHAYYALPERAGVIGITFVCALLLAIAGMLYQNAFKNPIAGPGLLGANCGVSVGKMLLVWIYGSAASSLIAERYALCYGCAAIALAIVIYAGFHQPGAKSNRFSIIGMLVIGMAISRVVNLAVQYITLYVWDDALYLVYYEFEQMLVVDTSALSWACLLIGAFIGLFPIIRQRFAFNGLAFDDDEVSLMGVRPTRLKAIALITGAIMMIVASIHCGMIGMVSLVVPFMSRNLFGCEFTKQFTGNLLISPVLVILCRDIADLIPFVGDGISVGAIVSIAALPIFIVVMMKQMRGWE